MPIIQLETQINAPIERCFDLSRSIDLHKLSTAQTNEEAIAGITSGLIGLNETITWRARHLGVVQTLTTKITALEYPDYFVDEMQSGAFRSFKHEHIYRKTEVGTLMTDVFDYVSPLGALGKLVDVLFLKQYMSNLLIRRNQVIKEFAESDRWKEILES